MADEIRVPPEILETFLKIKQLVDATVDQLQALPPLQLSASGTSTLTGTASLTVVGEPVRAKAHIPSPSVSSTARPDVVRATASIPIPKVTVTEEEVEEARQWVIGVSAAGVSVGATMAFFANLEGLLQFIDRLRGLIP